MRRVLLISALLLLGSPAAAAAESVKLLACDNALEPQQRAATFEARVRPAHGSERMQVRFSLQVREGGLLGWRRVVAGGLDQWLTSAAGVRRYSYAKTVQNLSAPAAYRTIVRFRWLDSDGAVLARSRVTSRVCRQADLRPDLAATLIEVAPQPEQGGALYAVTLRNRGRTAAGAFTVALRAGEQELEPIELPGLAAGEQQVVTWAGPACAADTSLIATVDTGLAIDERDEYDNVLASTCLP